MDDPELTGRTSPAKGDEGPEPGGLAEEANSPVPALGERFGLNLGNPLESEGAAFSWLILVILAAVSIGLVGKLISPLAAVIWLLILLGVVSVPLFKGLRHQLGSPEDDE